MRLYLIPVMGMCLGVDGLLLMAAKHLGGGEDREGCLPLAAALGALYAGVSAMPGSVAQELGLRLLSLVAVGVVAFGLRQLRCIAMYILLSLSVGRLVRGLDILAGLGMAVILLLCLMGGRPGKGRTVPVMLRYGQKQLKLEALCDTGNLLRDPVTGERVLVAGEYVAKALLGLERRQLEDPVETLRKQPVPGLRLLPYSSVGGSGFMLAMRLRGGRCGKPEGGVLVAFAPSGLEMNGKYHALTGGAV